MNTNGIDSTVMVHANNVRHCRYCKARIAWIESSKSGKSYPIDIPKREVGQIYVMGDKYNFHNCREVKE